MSTQKIYTDSVAEQIKDSYLAADGYAAQQEALLVLGKQLMPEKSDKAIMASMRAHCTRNGYYQKAPKVSRAGKTGSVKKVDFLDRIQDALPDLEDNDLDSLGKATRHALEVIANAVAN